MSRDIPRKAMVLAAGYGTRMRPLTHECTKAMMPFWGRPLLARTLDLLAEWGVREVIVNGHHRAGDLVEYVTHAHRPASLRVALSFEPQILGTGGALRRAEWFFDERPFWLINADIVAGVRRDPFIRAYRKHHPLAVLWMHPNKGPRTVSVRDGWVSDFRSETPGGDGTGTFCGLHLLDRRIFEYLPDEGFSSIVPAYERAMRYGERLAAVMPRSCFWADTGTPEEYLAAHAEYLEWVKKKEPGMRKPASVRRAGAAIEGFAALSDDVRVGRKAVITNSVLWPGVRVGSHARVEEAIVGSDVRVSGTVRHVVTRAVTALDARERDLLCRQGLDPARSVAETLPARGSARQYLRLMEGRKRVMMMRYDAAREENALYAGHARFLKRLGVPVPRIFHENRELGLILMEDLGDCSLLECVRARDWARVMPLYRNVLRRVSILHEKGAVAARRAHLSLMPDFGPKIYGWERDLFSTHWLKGVLGGDAGLVLEIELELKRAESRLKEQNAVLIHRDLQSSNILVRGGQVHVIDFQGMRMGPAAYDVASLLCDPYVEMPLERQRECLGWYGGQVPEDVFWWAAIQRLAQAIGAYARLAALPGCSRFREHITPALRMMERAIGFIGPMPFLQETVRRALGRRN